MKTSRPAIDPNMTVDEIMRRWPSTIRIFMRHDMLCVGCPIGTFHNVKDACSAHEVDEASFSADLVTAMRGDYEARAPSAFEPTTVSRRPPGDGRSDSVETR